MSDAQIHLVYGPSGAGKSQYSQQLASTIDGACFSIDEWMVQLFGPDQPEPLEVEWLFERVARCEARIWSTALSLADRGVAVVLDLGLMRRRDRQRFQELGEAASTALQFHYVTADRAVREQRVQRRNREQGATYALEVTPEMFEYSEQMFEEPEESELARSVVHKT